MTGRGDDGDALGGGIHVPVPLRESLPPSSFWHRYPTPTDPAAVVAEFNRIVLAVRQLLLALHGQSRFEKLGLQPRRGDGFEMLRDNPSLVLTQSQGWFEISTMISPTPTRAGNQAKARSPVSSLTRMRI
jgi:hypothetical protein